MSNFNQNQTFAGLGTLNFVCPETAPYTFEGKISLPSLNTDDGVSQCLVTIKQNTVTKYTGQAGAEGFHYNLACTALDSIDIIFSSAAAIDQGLNVIKSTISIYET